MALTTARDLIRKAFLQINIGAAGETSTAAEMSDALETLNTMIDVWAGEGLMSSADITEQLSISSGTGTYTIGTGQTFDTTKPFDIRGAYIRDSSNLDTVLAIVDRNNFNSEITKDTQGIPEKIFYDPGVTQQANQTGTLYFYPIPSDAYTLFLTSSKPFVQFSSLTANVTFPAAYVKAIYTNLALELAPEYGARVSPVLIQLAGYSKDVIRNINVRNINRAAVLDLPLTPGVSNIYTDS